MSELLLCNIHTIWVSSWYHSLGFTTSIVHGSRVQEFERDIRALEIDEMRMQIH
jgi:hypothetical protein